MDMIGYLAPKGWRVNQFNSISIKSDLFITTGNFVENREVQEELLYRGQPNFFTDGRWSQGGGNYYKSIRLTSPSTMSYKACIRRVKGIANLPVGTEAIFSPNFSYHGVKADLGYRYVTKEFNNLEVSYEVNLPEYSRNFLTCAYSQDLTEYLRGHGFLVAVHHNNCRLTGYSEDGEVAVAYGMGYVLGYSSGTSTYQGYLSGKTNILWEKYGHFDKWSRCNRVPKGSKNIINLLK